MSFEIVHLRAQLAATWLQNQVSLAHLSLLNLVFRFLVHLVSKSTRLQKAFRHDADTIAFLNNFYRNPPSEPEYSRVKKTFDKFRDLLEAA